ncbi:hypothetical protein [Bacillus sp. NPDC094106]|uniref:hypothetical protein n=1 Tax=Bacillus sp. NPDC094106 TaxID=3363949 RepID=UPI0038030F01
MTNYKGMTKAEELRHEYESHMKFIEALCKDKELINAIRMTDDKQYLVTLQNAYEDVQEGRGIFCDTGDINRCVKALKESKYGWIGMMCAEAIGQAKFQKQPYRYLFTDKTINNITIKQVQRLKEKYMGSNSVFPIVCANGIRILVFSTKGNHENYRMTVEGRKNQYGDIWYQIGEEKIFSWSDKYDNI